MNACRAAVFRDVLRAQQRMQEVFAAMHQRVRRGGLSRNSAAAGCRASQDYHWNAFTYLVREWGGAANDDHCEPERA